MKGNYFQKALEMYNDKMRMKNSFLMHERGISLFNDFLSFFKIELNGLNEKN